MVLQGVTAIAEPGPNTPAAANSRFLPQTPAPQYSSTPEGDFATVHLDHSPGKSGTTALFLPKGFDPGKPAILMPYFHGFGGGIADAFDRQRMAEIAAKSGKNIAFVVPQLGPKSDIKPEYRDPAYAAKFLDEAAKGFGDLYAHAHPGADAAIAAQQFQNMPVVPLSYSGGYQATLPNLKLPQVKGVMLLDSMYCNSAYFTQFAQRKDHPFVSIIYGDTTKDNTLEFGRNVQAGSQTVAPWPLPHDHRTLVQTALGGVLQSLSIGDNNVSVAGLPSKPVNVASRPVATTPS